MVVLILVVLTALEDHYISTFLERKLFCQLAGRFYLYLIRLFFKNFDLYRKKEAWRVLIYTSHSQGSVGQKIFGFHSFRNNQRVF